MLKNILMINLTDGSREISSEFVNTVKYASPEKLNQMLKDELCNFNGEARDTKRKKIIDRSNIIINRICKNLAISDVDKFDCNPKVKSIVEELNLAELSFEVIDGKKTSVESKLNVGILA